MGNKHNILFMLCEVWKIKPQKIILQLVYRIIDAASLYISSVVLFRMLIDALEKQSSSGDYYVIVLLFLLIAFIRTSFESFYLNYYKDLIDTIVLNKLADKLINKAASFELSRYEAPEFQDQYKMALDGIWKLPVQIVDDCADLFGYIVSILLVTIYLFTHEAVLLILGVSPFIAFLLYKRKNNILHEQYIETQKEERVKRYVDKVIYSKDYVKDMRMSNLYLILKNMRHKAVSSTISILNTKKVVLSMIGALSSFFSVTFVFFTGNIYAALRYIIIKNLVFSEYLAMINAIANFNNRLNKFIKKISRLHRYSLFVKGYRDFMSYTSDMKEGEISPCSVSEITFVNVSFTYPDASGPTLHDVSFTIRMGEKIAIVGDNGAGKTTIIKLLLRLYDCTSGNIFYNGINIKDLSIDKYRKLFGSVFQDYSIFALSLAENILCKEVSNEVLSIQEMCRVVNLNSLVDGCSEGIHTEITREYNPHGTDLSVGEQQKLAIARLLMSEHQIAILDEPSSALDPISEHQLYSRIFSLSSGKTIIYITHRLSTAITADNIMVFSAGKLVEQGNHRELINNKGIYYDLYAEQSSKYK